MVKYNSILQSKLKSDFNLVCIEETIMWWKVLIVCFLAGAGAGIGTGFAGMSAAAIIGPMLITFLDVPAYQAIGIGLASDVLASAASAWTYKKHGNLDIKGSLPLMISVLTMTVIGSFIASLLPDRAMSSAVQIALVVVGLKFIIFPNKNTRELTQNEKSKVIKAIVGGIIVGFICGFVGAGGGVMMLFVLTTFLCYDMHMAVGTSVFIMMFTAFTGSMSHFLIGGVPDSGYLALCIIFTLIWARISAKLANKATAATLSRVVGTIMVLIGIVVLMVNYI